MPWATRPRRLESLWDVAVCLAISFVVPAAVIPVAASYSQVSLNRLRGTACGGAASGFPAWAGCAEAAETKRDGTATPLVLRCEMGHVTAVDEAAIGMQSGRCEPHAFELDSVIERQQAAVEYERPQDEALCTPVEVRKTVASRCVGQATCKLSIAELLTASNSQHGMCRGALLRASARFRCGTDARGLAGGVGRRESAWYDLDVTQAELDDERSLQDATRGYPTLAPVLLSAATPEHPVACGLAYEASFAEVLCDSSGRPGGDDDALALLDDGSSFRRAGGHQQTAERVITSVPIARYGVFSGECSDDIDPADAATLPDAQCSVDVSDFVSAECVGKARCVVYSPPPGIRVDPCPQHKKALLIVAKCGAPQSSQP